MGGGGSRPEDGTIYMRSSVAPPPYGLPPAPPCGPVVRVDWCDWWLMES